MVHATPCILSIMASKKEACSLVFEFLFVILNMLKIVRLSKFSDYSDLITDVRSQCHLADEARSQTILKY